MAECFVMCCVGERAVLSVTTTTHGYIPDNEPLLLIELHCCTVTA